MTVFRTVCLCAAVLGLGLAAPAAADFETAEAPGGVYANPFSTSPANGTLTFSVGWDSNVVLAPDLPPFFPPGAKRDSTYIAFSFDGAWVRSISAYTYWGIAGEISGVNSCPRPEYTAAIAITTSSAKSICLA